jgi:hypothetical protein
MLLVGGIRGNPLDHLDARIFRHEARELPDEHPPLGTQGTDGERDDDGAGIGCSAAGSKHQAGGEQGRGPPVSH